jgi:serine/threonine protein phosphatase 1
MIGIIGDIHGCYHTLVTLVEKVGEKYPGITLYSVGDIVDRGNFSHLVIEYIQKTGIRTVLGNHDNLFCHAFFSPGSPWALVWEMNGCQKTMAYYSQNESLWKIHAEFIKKFPLYYISEGCLITHAGISRYNYDGIKDNLQNKNFDWNELLKISQDDEFGVLWNRTPLQHLDLLQVVGHTRHQDVDFNKSNNAVYIDTAACAGNKLSCVVAGGGEIIDIILQNTLEPDIS